MPKVKTHTFGPGSLESLTLKTWVVKREERSAKYKARLTGRYTVYCGEGNEHDVDINEEDAGWTNDFGGWGSAILKAHEDEVTLDFVANLIEWALEDWFDPCEVEED